MKGGLSGTRAQVRRLGDRAERVATTLASSGGLRAIATWRPFSLAAYRLVDGLVREGLSFATVLDVGANRGQFARAALGRWPGVRILAFEPLPDVASALEASLRRVGSVDVHAVALGAADGSTTLIRHSESRSSSVLGVSESALGEAWAEEIERLDVPLRRLDAVVSGRELGRPALLKLDVQGYELEVLGGAPATLARMDAVLVEASFQPTYRGQPAFGEVDATMREAGWRMVRPLDWWRAADGGVVEMDFLYTRAPAGRGR